MEILREEQSNRSELRDFLAGWLLPGIVLLMNVQYFYAAFLDGPGSFGFTQLRKAEVLAVLVVWAIAGVLFFLTQESTLTRLRGLVEAARRVPVSRTTIQLGISLGAGLAFFSLRNNLMNSDGQAFQQYFETEVPLRGAYLTHDELLEFLLHSKFWQLTHAWFGWSVPLTYQVFSSAAGAVFIFLLQRLADVAVPARRWLFCLLVASGGFMQLFFGEVENYTLVNTCLVIYVLCAHRFLTGRTRLVVPAIVMAIAMSLHLLAGWLLPSLLVLGGYSLKTRPVREFWTAVGAFFATLMAVLCFVKVVYGLPFSALYYGSHALGHGGHDSGHFFGPSFSYYVDIFNLVFLLFPGVPVLLVVLLSRRVRWEPFNVFLGVLCASALLFIISWRALLGVLNDWNLFAVVGLVLSLFCWRVCLQDDRIASRPRILALMVVTFGLHTYSWILFNHSFGLRG